MALRHLVAFGALVSLLGPASAVAQPLGTFKWQLQPHCNVLTVAVTQNAGVFELEGTDDQCGAPGTRASAIGTAFINADGTVGMGLTIVTSPGGAPVHVDATITVATLGGTWRDSAENTGSFVFTPGAGTGGSPRPAPATGILPGSVGSAHINAAQVQRRITDSCSTGSFMRSVGEDGSAACGFETGDVSAVAAGAGLVGGGASGSVSLSIAKTASGAFNLSSATGILSTGFSGAIPATGAGIRFFWYPAKSAIRAGGVSGAQWDDANVGFNSVAMGADVVASGSHSAAIGSGSIASGAQSVALNASTTASGARALAAGAATTASGITSVALGLATAASGTASFGMGDTIAAFGHTSVALGFHAAAGNGAFSFADRSTTTPFTAFDNQFGARAIGGVGFYTTANLTAGVELAPGSSSWSSVSDVNMKEHFRDLHDDDVLAKIARMPIREWNYKTQDASIRHIGPTAQDFHTAFGLGEDPLRINTIDADGIALRAIQALESRTRTADEHTRALEAEVVALRERLAQLEQLLLEKW